MTFLRIATCELHCCLILVIPLFLLLLLLLLLSAQEYGPEVAYLLANLLGYMGPSGMLQQPTLHAAAAILNVWSRRRSRITADGLLHDSKVFALLEASWAQLYVHQQLLLLTRNVRPNLIFPCSSRVIARVLVLLFSLILFLFCLSPSACSFACIACLPIVLPCAELLIKSSTCRY